MRKFQISFILAGVLCFLAAGTALAQQSSRTTDDFDAGWRFIQQDVAKAQTPGFNDRSWRQLDLPHDWSIEGENRQDAPGGGSIGYFPRAWAGTAKLSTCPVTARTSCIPSSSTVSI